MSWMPKPSTFLCAAACSLVAACSLAGPEPAPPPAPAAPPPKAMPAFVAPPTRTDPVLDDYHGTEVADPYRWLEDQDGAEVTAWARTQNDAARAVLDAIPERAPIRARLAELWNHARYDAPERAGEHWFWRKNDGLQNQAVLYTGSDPAGDGEVLLDPNALSRDGTVAIGAVVPAHDGSRIAYAVSARGSDWRQWRVLDVASKTTLPDLLEWSKFSGAAWTHDGKGFFYQRYPAPAEGEVYQAENKSPQLCYHTVGTEQGADKVVYERPDEPRWAFNPQVTEDGRYLVVTVSHGTDRRNRIAFADLGKDPWQIEPLLMDFDASWGFVGNDADSFFFLTDKDAPRGRLVALSCREPQKVRELVAQQPSPLRGVHLTGHRFVCSYLHDAASAVELHGIDGAPLGTIDLPALGTASGFTGKPDDGALFFTLTTFTAPPAIYRYDFADGALQPFRVPAFRGETKDLVAERVFLQSRDGTRLCMFLVHHREFVNDGRSPCYLYGYGGFDIPTTPGFSVPNFVFVERGGIYAHAVLRGGGEYGEEWHQAGMLGNKQNVFDDFIACAEYLVRNGFTSRDHLAIGGGSNGGLLVGAVLTQRPDLVGAAVPQVGVLDMLRYHRFTIGWAWASEYGTSDDSTQFGWLYHYSPLHNVKPGTKYPPTLIMTGDHDDRVLPGHSYKFAATLQQAQAGPAPILLRVETDAGHGAGKPVGKLIDEAADRLAFLAWALE